MRPPPLQLAAYPWRLAPSQWVSAARASLARAGTDRLALVQLHWSAANYAPLQERLMWEGLVAIYEEASVEACQPVLCCAVWYAAARPPTLLPALPCAALHAGRSRGGSVA